MHLKTIFMEFSAMVFNEVRGKSTLTHLISNVVCNEVQPVMPLKQDLGCITLVCFGIIYPHDVFDDTDDDNGVIVHDDVVVVDDDDNDNDAFVYDDDNDIFPVYVKQIRP